MAQTQLILGWPYILPKGFLVLLWLGWFSLNVLYCSGLPESVCATQFKVTLSGWLGRADFWAQALLLIWSF